MTVPLWLFIAVVAVAALLLLATILMFFAWKGMDLMNRELQARLNILQVDVTGLFGPDRMRHVRGRDMIEEGRS